MGSWNWAELSSSGGSSTHNRDYAERWSRKRAQSSRPTLGHFDHYEEKAREREAAQREAEANRNAAEWSSEWREREDAISRFRADDPEPFVPGPDADDFYVRMDERAEWEKRRDAYLDRVEGEKIAARIKSRF